MYAENTTVSVEKSKAEIERTLQRYGAGEFMHGWNQNQALVAFSMEGRRIKFILAMPSRDSDEFYKTPTGKRRTDEAAYKEWEKACRQRWRALALVIKAKLEAVESGITVFDDEFMAHIVLPGGETVSEFMQPQIEQAYLTGDMPAMLPYLGEK